MARVVSYLSLAVLAILVINSPLFAQGNRGYPPELPGSQTEVYKTIGETKLSLWIFTPLDHRPSDSRPAIVFFFGGGWQNGSPGQFEQQCRYLASRGMVAITADYRVGSRHGVKVVDCVRDAKSAIRYVRTNAARLGIDPEKIAAGGGSAGGHLAACCGTLNRFDEPGEDKAISSRPNALVLFNPPLQFAPSDRDPVDSPRWKQLVERMGATPGELSPVDHLTKDIPPTLILIGTKDLLIDGNREFAKRMRAVQCRCDLVEYPGQDHGFFNFGRQENRYYRETVIAMDKFLESLGYLVGPPTLVE